MVNMINEFIELCREGFLEEARIMLNENPDIDIHYDNELAFRESCKENNIYIAKWLLEIKPDINVSEMKDDAFCAICCKGNDIKGNSSFEFAKWLFFGTWHSAVAYFIPLALFTFNDAFFTNGKV